MESIHMSERRIHHQPAHPHKVITAKEHDISLLELANHHPLQDEKKCPLEEVFQRHQCKSQQYDVAEIITHRISKHEGHDLHSTQQWLQGGHGAQTEIERCPDEPRLKPPVCFSLQCHHLRCAFSLLAQEDRLATLVSRVDGVRWEILTMCAQSVGAQNCSLPNRHTGAKNCVVQDIGTPAYGYLPPHRFVLAKDANLGPKQRVFTNR
mmetsp:Transcript_30203/g.69461  ORF Transcript_30203/g.69461 Transcript_30203/m.69461 type:complete len:208 (+) Transcript_30203:690-1313(+)